jgi:phosphonate transport system permease protein
MVEWSHPEVVRTLMSAASEQWETLERLGHARPRNWGARASVLLMLILGVGSWIVGDFGASELVSARRLSNIKAFVSQLVPFPLQSTGFDAGILFEWLVELMRSRGLEAAINTLAISIAAIFLAGWAGALLSVLGARTLQTDSPFLPPIGPTPWPMRWLWLGVQSVCRLFMIFTRSIPEYIWAFLFLAMLGPVAWPLVLALTLHNTGILGRLGAEVVENTESPPLVALSALGATRSQLVFSGVFPLAFSRFLLFFLYRWETCVREATVLGMLGISSLGFWIQDARARNHYDEMLFLIILGAGLVLIGDLLSAAAREWVRRQN